MLKGGDGGGGDLGTTVVFAVVFESQRLMEQRRSETHVLVVDGAVGPSYGCFRLSGKA